CRPRPNAFATHQDVDTRVRRAGYPGRLIETNRAELRPDVAPRRGLGEPDSTPRAERILRHLRPPHATGAFAPPWRWRNCCDVDDFPRAFAFNRVLASFLPAMPVS